MAARVLWTGVWESLVLAIVIQIIGTITVDILSDLTREMRPSLPPGWAPKPMAEAEPSVKDSVVRAIGQHQLAIIFAFVYVGRIGTLLLRSSPNPKHRRVALRLRRGWHFLKEHWARLVLVNAFTAFGLTLALQFTQQFSWTQILWHSVAGAIGPWVHAVLNGVPGGESMERLAYWYNANQLKFQFWLLYSAAICDDLGLANYKTLGRRLWRRIRHTAPSPDSDPLFSHSQNGQTSAPDQPIRTGNP